MDGDSSAKALDQGANSAMANTESTSSIHETSKQGPAGLGEKTTGSGTSAFDKQGAIGKQFTTDGAIGGAAQKIGGPLAADGMIGKNFTAQGAIGGTVQDKIAEQK